MVFGCGSSPMSFAGSSSIGHIPTVFTRSINLRPVGTSLPASPADIQIRQWPPSSNDSRFRSSRASASELQFCARWRQRPCGSRAVRRDVRPSFSEVRSVSLGGSRRTPPQTTIRASPHHRISTRGLTNLPLRIDGALASVQETRRHPRCG